MKKSLYGTICGLMLILGGCASAPDTENMTAEEQQRLAQMSAKTIKCAQMFVGAIPILIVYPFLQKYFVSGITLGSVKG